jgi:hypothetical protein
MPFTSFKWLGAECWSAGMMLYMLAFTRRTIGCPKKTCARVTMALLSPCLLFYVLVLLAVGVFVSAATLPLDLVYRFVFLPCWCLKKKGFLCLEVTGAEQ